MFQYLGHNQSAALSFSSFAQVYDGTGGTSTTTNEFCFINLQVIRYNDARCAPYNSQGNGNCIPSFITFNR
ncbi:MAG: hypothetical protein CL920_00805, partial [Deltaproteobacteria bacterium]|nr:hypothetical protein [Deltaproteobacteria bacterium]